MDIFPSIVNLIMAGIDDKIFPLAIVVEYYINNNSNLEDSVLNLRYVLKIYLIYVLGQPYSFVIT